MNAPNDILGERDPNVPDRPTRVAEPSRESALPKRFYTNAEILTEEGAFTVALDGKPVRTPGRKPLSVPNEALARSMVAEWAAQSERIDPLTMPLTRLVNTALDGVANDMQAVREDIVRFAGTDLLCYRATGPEPLQERQETVWGAVLDWAQERDMVFQTIEGITHIQQPAETIRAFGSRVGQVNDAVLLTALHLVTSLTGSAILALAVLEVELNGEAAWDAAHLDEDWNIEQWGPDEEAMARRALRWRDMQAAVETIHALR